MRMSDWSSDVCSSDLPPASGKGGRLNLRTSTPIPQPPLPTGPVHRIIAAPEKEQAGAVGPALARASPDFRPRAMRPEAFDAPAIPPTRTTESGPHATADFRHHPRRDRPRGVQAFLYPGLRLPTGVRE